MGLQGILFPLTVLLTLTNTIHRADAKGYWRFNDGLGSVWSGWGGNIMNNRWVQSNTEVSLSSVQQLTKHCQVDFEYGVSAPPALWSNTAYFPTWNGLFVAYDYTKCQTKWQTNITAILYDYATPGFYQSNTSLVLPVSRTSPQIDCKNGALYLATQLYALLLALDINTGSLLASIPVNPHPLAVVTMSPTLYDGKIFIGGSSVEETAATIPSYECCSFAGNFAAFAFDRTSGFSVVWNETMIQGPVGPGQWSGAAVWGSQPAIDVKRGNVHVATGNVYYIPKPIQACINATGNDNETACYSTADIKQESIIAYKVATGETAWHNELSALDAWTVACGIPGAVPVQASCPPHPGPDADFGMAPAFVSGQGADTPNGRDVVVTGQKSGNLYALDAGTGKLHWTVLTSPDSGPNGGLSWGVAVDKSQVYFTALNAGAANWTLKPGGPTISWSAIGAASLATGDLLWETPVPHKLLSNGVPTVANDVVIVGATGNIYVAGQKGSVAFLNKASGEIVKDLPVNALEYGGIAVQDQYVMFGSGYKGWEGKGSFYVYTVPGSCKA